MKPKSKQLILEAINQFQASIQKKRLSKKGKRNERFVIRTGNEKGLKRPISQFEKEYLKTP